MNEGMTKNEIDIISKCIKGSAKGVVKKRLILAGEPEQILANAIVISIGFAESWRGPVDYCHLLFYACTNHVQVFVCWSKNYIPFGDDDFFFSASHDSGWADDGLYRFVKRLEEASYRIIISYETEILKIEPGNFRYIRDNKVPHVIDRKKKTFEPRKMTE
jgi:hypothetical protein